MFAMELMGASDVQNYCKSWLQWGNDAVKPVRLAIPHDGTPAAQEGTPPTVAPQNTTAPRVVPSGSPLATTKQAPNHSPQMIAPLEIMNIDTIYITDYWLHWDWRVATDLFLGSAGVGALIVAVAVDELHKGKHRSLSHTAAVLAPLLILAGLGLLLLKLGQPWNLHQTIVNVNLQSPLWWGGVSQTLLVVGSLVYAALWHRSRHIETWSTRRLLGRLLVPIAVFVGTYHGVLLSVNAARPLWNSEAIILLAMLSFVVNGVAVVMLGHFAKLSYHGQLAQRDALKNDLGDLQGLRNVLGVCLASQIVVTIGWWLSLNFGGANEQIAVAAAMQHYGGMLWFGGVGLGLVMPLILGAAFLLFSKQRSVWLEVATISLTSVLILFGGLLFRISLIYAGQLPLFLESIGKGV